MCSTWFVALKLFTTMSSTHFYRFTNKVGKHPVYEPLIGSPSIF